MKPAEQASADVSGSYDDQLINIVEQYLAELDAGRRPDRRAFLEEHPEYGETLASFLDGLEFVHDVAPQLQDNVERDDGNSPRQMPHPAALGDFQLIREIGRGGMGVVYEAEQLSLSRRVALKILPFAATLDPRQLERFKNEARSAAMLKHPNIVSVYSVGYERGVHYYAMELVDGESLAGVIERLGTNAPTERQLSGEFESRDLPNRLASSDDDTQPVAELSTQHSDSKQEYFRSVARLGIQAAQALHYAHEQGVVHRDIKPSNLLLNQHASISISDFGLAQVQGDHNLTMTGDLLGTLRYMSPEQAEGRKLLDHRTDIYSLGVTLHELLTLEPVFAGENRQQLLAQVIESQPCPLRKCDRSIPSDLETIMLKAAARNAESRYDTAQELAEDLKRFLDHRPIRARRPKRWESLWSVARRNPVAAGLSLLISLMVLILAVAGPLAAIQYRRLAEQEAISRADADAARKDVQEVLDRAVIRAVDAIKDQPGLEHLRQELLEDATDYYQKLYEKRPDDPTIAFETGVAIRRLGRSYAAAGDKPKGVRVVQRGADILKRLADSRPENNEYRYELAEAHRIMASNSPLDEESLVHLSNAVDLLEELVSRTSNADHVRLLSECRLTIAGKLRHRGSLAAAESQVRLALNVLNDRFTATEPHALDFYGMANCHDHLGRIYQYLNRPQQAQVHYDKSLSMWNMTMTRAEEVGIQTRPQGITALAVTRWNYCPLLIGMYEFAHAAEQATLAIQDLSDIRRDFPRYDRAARQLSHCHISLAEAQLGMGNSRDAEAALQDAISAAQAYYDNNANGNNDARRPLAKAQFRLGLFRWWEGDREAAATAFEQSKQKMLLTLSAADSRHTGPRKDLLRFLANCPDASFQDPEMIVQLLQKTILPEDGRYELLMGIANYQTGQWQDAIDALTRSRRLMYGGDAFHQLFLSMAHAQLGNDREAHAFYSSAVAAIENREPVCLVLFMHPRQLHDYVRQAENLLATSNVTTS